MVPYVRIKFEIQVSAISGLTFNAHNPSILKYLWIILDEEFYRNISLMTLFDLMTVTGVFGLYMVALGLGVIS